MMLKGIEIKEDTLLSEILIPKKVDLNNQVCLLFGSNGVGKSTLIKALLGREYKNQFKSDLEGKPPLMYSYIDSIQNAKELSVKNPHLTYNDFFDPSVIARKFDADELSEGQSIIYTVQEFLYCAEKVKKDEPCLFIVDEIDSGLSVDNIVWFCEEIKKIIKDNKNIQFIIAFNNYEFCNQFGTVVSMYDGKQRSINGYEEYKQILLDNREVLLKIRNYNQFQKL